jgi:hypothetical protein
VTHNDAWTDFLEDMPEPTPRSRAARVTRENPYSQNPDDPYVDLVAEGLVFDTTDHRSHDRDRVRIEEVSHITARSMTYGYGYRYLADGRNVSTRQTLGVPLRTDELPAALLERLGLT